MGSWGTAKQPPPVQETEFRVLPWRWIVERTYAWLGRFRRLSKDYEHLPESARAWILIAMRPLMLSRIV